MIHMRTVTNLHKKFNNSAVYYFQLRVSTIDTITMHAIWQTNQNRVSLSQPGCMEHFPKTIIGHPNYISIDHTLVRSSRNDRISTNIAGYVRVPNTPRYYR